MTRRDGGQAEKLRVAVRHLLDHGYLKDGDKNGAQTTLARHFGVSRQRVHQIVSEQRRKHD